MTNKEKLMEKLNLKKEQFEPKKEQTTIDDVVEALNVLAEMVIGGGEQDD